MVSHYVTHICTSCNGTGQHMSSMTCTGWCRECGGTGVFEYAAPTQADAFAELDEALEQNDCGAFTDIEDQADLAHAAEGVLRMNWLKLAAVEDDGEGYLHDQAVAWAESRWSEEETIDAGEAEADG